MKNILYGFVRGIGSSLVSSARGVLKTMGGETLSASFYDDEKCDKIGSV